MKRTYLYSEHKKLGAKFVEFGGWEMPLQYTSIIDEHNNVRTNIGVFDTSHMGTFIVRGEDSERFLNYVMLGNISGLPNKKARYSMLLNENGGVKDDVIVYKFGFEYMVVANAGNLEKDFNWLNKQKKTEKVKIRNISTDICLISVQGPKSPEVLQSICETYIKDMKYFTISSLKLKDIDADFCRVARTGYTGEDGFEIFISKERIVDLWKKFMSLSIKPCGLGCRDTLRLEACMPLHGHEIDENINPIDAGFQKTINWDSDFIGKNKLLLLKDKPLRRSIAFECSTGVARNADKIFLDGKEIGYVTSGSFSPTLKKAVGMALIETNVNVKTDNELEVEIHNSKRKIKTLIKPLYKRAR
ncbi:MAG: glycine cleavage system aminomethyltransferase GcvT [Endomicrobium sp.]|jgi:glycine cleavage system T protein|nr:glycine cleavage system aminomethyltransferase GcvT [Endomicrobium sp.]